MKIGRSVDILGSNISFTESDVNILITKYKLLLTGFTLKRQEANDIPQKL